MFCFFFALTMLWFAVSVFGALGVIIFFFFFLQPFCSTKPRQYLALVKGNKLFPNRKVRLPSAAVTSSAVQCSAVQVWICCEERFSSVQIAFKFALERRVSE